MVVSRDESILLFFLLICFQAFPKKYAIMLKKTPHYAPIMLHFLTKLLFKIGHSHCKYTLHKLRVRSKGLGALSLSNECLARETRASQ